MPEQKNFEISCLGERRYTSPLTKKGKIRFASDDTRVVYNTEIQPDKPQRDPILFERAGARRDIYFEPAKTTAATRSDPGSTRETSWRRDRNARAAAAPKRRPAIMPMPTRGATSAMISR